MEKTFRCQFSIANHGMENDVKHLRHAMLFCFHKGFNVRDTVGDIRKAYGITAVTEPTVYKWFRRFQQGDFNLDDRPRGGRPSTVDADRIRELIKAGSRLSLREMAELSGVPRNTLARHLKELGYVNRINAWVPHELSTKNLMDRVSTCELLVRRHQREPFLKNLVTGDETWIFYNNVVRKRSWSKRGSGPVATPKSGLHPKKVLLSVWWDHEGVIFYELLPVNQTINTEVYCRQLDLLRDAIAKRRPVLANRRGIVYHHDNARPHVAMPVLQKLRDFDWEVLPHPPYSPDLAPSDYYLFRALKAGLASKTFKSVQEVQEFLDAYFARKPKIFYSRGIERLPGRWAKVIAQSGAHIID